MLMYIDKAGHNQAAFGVDVLCFGICIFDILSAAHLADRGSVDGDRAVFDQRTASLVMTLPFPKTSMLPSPFIYFTHILSGALLQNTVQFAHQTLYLVIEYH